MSHSVPHPAPYPAPRQLRYEYSFRLPSFVIFAWACGFIDWSTLVNLIMVNNILYNGCTFAQRFAQGVFDDMRETLPEEDDDFQHTY